MTRPLSTMKPGWQADHRLTPTSGTLASGDPSAATSPHSAEPTHQSQPQILSSLAEPPQNKNQPSLLHLQHAHYVDTQVGSAEPADDNHGQDPVITGTADDSDDQLYFVLGWRHVRKEQILSQGVANHETPADQLPDRLRVALLDWLKSRT